jgi:hypothetical protein
VKHEFDDSPLAGGGANPADRDASPRGSGTSISSASVADCDSAGLYATIAQVQKPILRGKCLISRYFRIFTAFLAVSLAAAAVPAQSQADGKAKEEAINPEGLAELVIFIYGGGLGRQNLDQIRKTTFERGKTVVHNTNGSKDNATYERFVIRGENLDKEKVRIDQSIAGSKFSLISNGERLFGIYNDTIFTPRQDAAEAFKSLQFNGLEAILRYKENESKLEYAGRDRQRGVDYYLVDVTAKDGRKTRFYISVKQLRVLMLEYENGGVKYRRRFYDHNIAQGTLVPFRSVLWAGDRIVEETEILTITFGQKVDENLFVQS